MKLSTAHKIGRFFQYFVLILVGVIMIYPLVWMVGATFKSNAEIFAGIGFLTANPTLQGRVSVKLVIGKNGGTKSAAVASTDLADKEVATCVAKVFGSLSFPQPERDEVTVVYPIAFSPGEAP